MQTLSDSAIQESHNKREIGDFAVWSLSSAKPRFDVSMLRDGDTETHWQSDGPAPHFINIQFSKKMTVTQIALFLDYTVDESYTPCHILLRMGNTLLDLQEIKSWEFEEPKGWISFSLPDTVGRAIRAYLFQIVVLENASSGRDSRIRQIKIFGPKEGEGKNGRTPNFDEPELFMYNTIR